MTEYEQLKKRVFKDYSRGHQLMYLAPILSLEGSRWDILDIGFGIGFGLQRMIGSGIIKLYTGCEPDKDSFEFVKEQQYDVTGLDINIFNKDFLSLDLEENKFDYTFLVEVIEHVPKENAYEFLKKIHKHTRQALFLSTPDKNKSKEGIYSNEELEQLFMECDFNYSVVKSQWTDFWTLNPINK